ncbi:class III extradiol dioxygenase subunit B-like domain-containing protein [Streptomonospora litoralis]|uniref:class III extradiol dioxygenase subunit B-like domain-containing protein n=1 Tax=Streptomonospora litoralis TaxID=2498135 RepID=UPI001036CD1B|nr:class III extradiol dioxygenase subunit B-like domain-containing protein [Streptomonospora litoralis]
MLISAAVCPHPPLLIPQVARGAAEELAALRAACDRAVQALAASGPDAVAVAGCGSRNREYGPDAAGDLGGYGVQVRIGSGPPELPLSLTVGRWLCERSGMRPDRYVEVAEQAEVAECVERGAALAASADRVALLVMGDGSARRGEHAPGRPDPRAAGFDSTVARALAEADTAALERVDPESAAELMAAGRGAWQVLAGAANGAGLRGELLAHEAPYGVGYFTALWR